jgi:hypothetical protein
MFVTYQEFEDYQEEEGARILEWMLFEIGHENVQKVPESEQSLTNY